MNYVLGILRLCKVEFNNRSSPLIITDEKKTVKLSIDMLIT